MADVLRPPVREVVQKPDKPAVPAPETKQPVDKAAEKAADIIQTDRVKQPPDPDAIVKTIADLPNEPIQAEQTAKKPGRIASIIKKVRGPVTAAAFQLLSFSDDALAIQQSIAGTASDQAQEKILPGSHKPAPVEVEKAGTSPPEKDPQIEQAKKPAQNLNTQSGREKQDLQQQTRMEQRFKGQAPNIPPRR